MRALVVHITSKSADLEVYIMDENDNILAKGTSGGLFEEVNWTPKKTGTYKIVVVNPSKKIGSKFTLCLA